MPQTALNLDSRSTKLNNELLLAKTETRKSVLPKFTSIKFEAKFKKGEIMPNQIRQVFSNQPVLSLKVHVFESVNPNDYEKLVSYYTKAANDGIPEGMFYLAMLYESGTGIDLNEQETFQWLFKAATATQGKGIIEAQHSLGLRYYAGSGVNRNPQKAAEWFEKAVENGCEASANNLGVLYKFGEGVVQSSEKAFYYFKLAAENGDITGMQNLAHCYFTTQGTEIHELIEEHMKEGTAKRAAKNGSKTAEKVLNIWRHMDDAINAYEQNDATNLVAALSKAIRLDFETVQIPKLFKVLIEERIKTEEDDINTIVCFVHINMKSCDFPIYVVRYLNRYRFDEYLFEMLIYSFMQIGELEAGLNFAENASKTWPNSLRLKYCYAIALCKQDNPCPKVISALDAFINTAPPDHEKLPSCYYRKAEYYGFMKNNAKFIESYEAAQDSEKRQLPCF
uniref:Uncharacterized protein n=1 Tax=Panagrolaimus superbus TaxID=310955 RepID=A0A914YWD7_9BILA